MAKGRLGVLLWLSAAAVLLPQEPARGPYLQLGTPDSIIVRWRTSAPSDSRVRYGTEAASLDRSVSVAAVTTEHKAKLTGLTPSTRYFYSIGSTATAPARPCDSCSFTTAPGPNGSGPVRVWVLGDSGTADERAAQVRDSYLSYSGERPTDVWLMLGDNAYRRGTEEEFQRAVFDTYRPLLSRWILWPAFGNHDGHSADSDTQTGPYYDIFSLPKDGEAGGESSGTEAYYSFNYGNIHFICLDSHDSDRSPGGPMATWLRKDLASHAELWTVAYWHHPPYSKGSHDSDRDRRMTEMRQNILPVLEAGGVDVVLSGHSHSYERSVLLAGHYGASQTLTAEMKKAAGNGRPDGDGAYRKSGARPARPAGTVYVVVGSSGKTERGPLNHQAMAISLQKLGSLVLEFRGNRLDAAFLDSSGKVEDRFAIVKDGSSPETMDRRPRARASRQSGATIE